GPGAPWWVAGSRARRRGRPAPGGRRTSTRPAPCRAASGRDGGRAPPSRSARPRRRPARPPASPAARGRCRARGPPAARRRSARLPAADDVQGAASLEPLDLLVAHGVRSLELDPHATGLVEHTPYRPVGGEVRQAEHADAVVLLDGVVGGRVGEGQRQDALLLEVGLVDAGEAAGEDHPGPPVAGLHGGVLTGAALAVVLVADHAPRDALGVEPAGDLGEGPDLAVQRVLAVAGLDVVPEGVDRAQEEVARDVLQVA